MSLSQNSGDRTPPLQNLDSNSYSGRYEVLLSQERDLQRELDELMANPPDEVKMAADLRTAEDTLHQLKQEETHLQSEIARIKGELANNKERDEEALALLTSEENAFRRAQADFLQRSQGIDAASSRMQKEFDLVSAELRVQHQSLLVNIQSTEAEIRQLEEKDREAEEARLQNKAMQDEIRKLQEDNAMEKTRAASLEKEIAQLQKEEEEQDRLIAETEHHLSAIRSQHAHELSIYQEYKAAFLELQELAAKAKGMESEYAAAQKDIQAMETILQRAIDADREVSTKFSVRAT